MQSQINIQPDNFHFPARNYADIHDQFNRAIAAGAASASMINFPVPPQGNYGAPAGAFTISGLNLNLGAGMRAAPQPPQLGMTQQDVSAAVMGGEQAAVYGGDMNNNRFEGMEQCGDLDNYWPSY